MLLYVISISIEKPEFIAIWLTLKTALRWDRDRNKNDAQSTTDRIADDITMRGTYLTFLIGNGINIILAFSCVWLLDIAFGCFK
jgi:hypothetical protein